MVVLMNSSDIQALEFESKRMVLKELKTKGASHRQLERLTGVGRGADMVTLISLTCSCGT